MVESPMWSTYNSNQTRREKTGAIAFLIHMVASCSFCSLELAYLQDNLHCLSFFRCYGGVSADGCLHDRRFDDDSPVSPGTVALSDSNYFSAKPDVPPKSRTSGTKGFRESRKDLRTHDQPSHNIPAISKDPPSAPMAEIAPWAADSTSNMPSTAMLPPSRSFFDDSTDEGPSSPVLRPDTARTDTSDSLEAHWRDEDRRPSVASATTVGSQESSFRSGGNKNSYRKKLAGFFGEDVDGANSQRSSDSNVPPPSARPFLRTRNNSVQTNNADTRPVSPSSSRPRTPAPSSDVVPWMFQDFKVRSSFPTFCTTQACIVLSLSEGHIRWAS